MADEKYREGQLVGQWIGIGIALFAGVGVVLATATDNPGLIGIGPAIGVAFGAAVGSSLERRYRREGRIRPLTDAERGRQNRARWVGVALLVAGLTVVVTILLA